MNAAQPLTPFIQEFDHALMMPDVTGLAQLPVHLVNLVDVDEAGYAWFVIPRPSQATEAFGQINVRLDFFKKAKPFYIRVEGVARLHEVSEELPESAAFQSYRSAFWNKEVIAVSVDTQRAELYGQVPTPEKKPAQSLGSAVYSWLFRPVMPA